MASDVKEIWKEALKLLQEEMTSVSFSTWIEPIFPVSLENNLLTLEVPSEFNLGIINSRYKDLIQNAIRVLTKRDLNIELFVKSAELPKEDQTPNQDQLSSYISVLNPKYTFDTFVRGRNQQPMRRLLQLLSYQPRIILYSYMVVWDLKNTPYARDWPFIIERNPSRKVIYTSSEICNELIKCNQG